MQAVAESCYPSDTALPLDHIVARLEQMVAGEWPARHSPIDNFGLVADAMVKVCTSKHRVLPNMGTKLVDAASWMIILNAPDRPVESMVNESRIL